MTNPRPDSMAKHYDLINDIMSVGAHRLWKRYTVELSAARPGQTILDLAGGTGDLAAKLSRAVGSDGKVVLADINTSMLQSGRLRLQHKKHAHNILYVQSDTTRLPFAEHTFDCITLSMGLQAVPDKQETLSALSRLLKPGGRLLVLEYSTPTHPLIGKAMERYTRSVLPIVRRLFTAGTVDLRTPSATHAEPAAPKDIKHMMRKAGLEQVEYRHLTQGIVALHRGFKY